MKNMKPLPILLLMITIIMAACNKNKKQVTIPEPILNQPELITTLILTLSDSASTTNKVVASFRDTDGEGGQPPVITDTLKLAKNKTYYASIILLDETKVPIDTVSNEVLKEAVDHQFFFTHQKVAIQTTYRDKDAKNLPVGLLTQWRTKTPSTGTSKIVLRHQPGIKNGSEGPGETDVEVTFNTKIIN
jgi:hypothetical protein